MVGVQHLGRVATFLINKSELHIAQQTENNEDRSEIHIVRAYALSNGWRYGVHNIAHNRNRSRTGNSLIDEC